MKGRIGLKASRKEYLLREEIMRLVLSFAASLLPATLLVAAPAIGQDDIRRVTNFVEPEPLPQYQAGMQALRDSKFTEARIAFLKVLRSIDDHPKILTLTGVAYLGEGNKNAARRYFASAVRVDPTYVPARQELGILYAQGGEQEQARKQLAELKSMSESCDGKCASAEELSIAIREVTAALGA
jgi:Tfp pilus assembly protein PilF